MAYLPRLKRQWVSYQWATRLWSDHECQKLSSSTQHIQLLEYAIDYRTIQRVWVALNQFKHITGKHFETDKFPFLNYSTARRKITPTIIWKSFVRSHYKCFPVKRNCGSAVSEVTQKKATMVVNLNKCACTDVTFIYTFQELFWKHEICICFVSPNLT